MSSAPPPGFIPPPPPGIPPPATGPRGCWRTGLIGCGIAGLVLLLAIIAGFMYLRRNPQTITDWAMTQVDAHMAADVTEQDRRELHEAYDAYRTKMRQGTASPDGLRKVQSVFMSGSNNEISRDQVHELTAAFRRAAGLPPLTPSEPAPAGAATPAVVTPALAPSSHPTPPA